MSQGAMYVLQAWEACSGYQDKHTKNMHRAADSTGFHTCFCIHTHFRQVTKVLPATSTVYSSSSVLDKSVIMITAGKRGIQSMQDLVKVRCE